jgi:DNA-binding transcriptional MerR regulator
VTIKQVSEQYGISEDTLRYYERAGMIPAVPRTEGGIRDYGPESLGWVELAICMRAAGLPVEAMAEYVRLTLAGDSTFRARLRLLQEQREKLLTQKKQIEATLARLDFKISRYQAAVKTGILSWEETK